MATSKQTTDEGEGLKVKMPSNKPTAKEGSDEQGSDEQGGDTLHASSDAVPVSEEFQRATHKLLNGANKHHVMHVRNQINAAEDKMRRKETAKDEKNLDSFSSSDMPDSPY